MSSSSCLSFFMQWVSYFLASLWNGRVKTEKIFLSLSWIRILWYKMRLSWDSTKCRRYDMNPDSAGFSAVAIGSASYSMMNVHATALIV